jgi:Phosphotransferase enzyme family
MIELGDVNAPEPTGGRPPWQDPQWLADADEWITRSCSDAGLTRTDPAEARCRMWSVVARVPVTGGQVWFKANPAASAFEPALVGALSRWSPHDAPPVLAVDRDRAWALTRDVGLRLDGVFATNPDITQWHTPIQRYARLQIRLSEQVPDLLALGMHDLRPDVLADDAERLFADPGLTDIVHTPGGHPRGPSPAEFAAGRDRLPLVRAQCKELAALGIPASLDHSDLHPGNVLGSGAGARPFDWGDAVVGHPFTSLLIVLNSAPEFCGVPDAGPELAALRDAYLEPWIEHGVPRQEALRAVDLALLTGALSRARAWLRMFPCYAANPEPRANAARWLARLGTTNPLTDA